MVMTRRVGPFPAKTFAREKSDYDFEFSTSGGAVTALSQDEGVVASVAYTSAGLYAVTLNQRFARIYGYGNVQKGAVGWKAQVTDIVDGGAATNTFNVRVANASDAAADPDAPVNIRLSLVTAFGSGRTTS